jgi:hypothetical protein
MLVIHNTYLFFTSDDGTLGITGFDGVFFTAALRPRLLNVFKITLQYI